MVLLHTGNELICKDKLQNGFEKMQLRRDHSGRTVFSQWLPSLYLDQRAGPFIMDQSAENIRLLSQKARWVPIRPHYVAFNMSDTEFKLTSFQL